MGVTIIVLLVIAVISLMLSRKIANALVTVNRLFVSLSNGDLTMKVDPNMLKRNDEIGEMAGSVQALISKLNGIVTGLTESADQLYKSGDGILYLPWYMVIFSRQEKEPEQMIYEIDLSGL